MYKKAPRRYQIKAENAKIGIADVPIERNPVMEVPALVFSARRGIDVLDWCVAASAPLLRLHSSRCFGCRASRFFAQRILSGGLSRVC
jgi:hypothetical protein